MRDGLGATGKPRTIQPTRAAVVRAAFRVESSRPVRRAARATPALRRDCAVDRRPGRCARRMSSIQGNSCCNTSRYKTTAPPAPGSACSPPPDRAPPGRTGPLDLGRTHRTGVALAAALDEPAYPPDICLLSAQTVVLQLQAPANLVQKPRCRCALRRNGYTLGSGEIRHGTSHCGICRPTPGSSGLRRL